MHSARSPDDEMYPYEYRYYRKPTAHSDVENNERGLRRSQIYKYGDAESELLYSCKPSEHEKAINDEDDANYAEPTMPYYVVPVLYVPKRVMPSDEIQQSQVQPAPKTNPTRCYTKSTQEIDRYERYRSYYNQYYARQANADANVMDTGLAHDASYYNVHYSGSSTSFKDDIPADYSQTYSYTYMPKPKVNPKIRTLKSHPACLSQDYEAKIKARNTYECKSRHNTNAYYYPESKEIYYDNLEQQQQEYYTYPPEVPQRFNRTSEYKSIANQVPVVENKPTRIAGNCNKPNESVDAVKAKEVLQIKPKVVEEKQQSVKNLVERGTQTLENRMNTGTVSTQTDVPEKKSMIPSCRPKVQIENVYSDEEDAVLPEAKHKETTRSPSAKRPSTAFQGVDQHPTRMQSPVRRSRKF